MNGALVIRYACIHDAPALARLAALDSAPTPRGEVLVAEVDGVLLAALALEEGRAVADPFVATAELVALLRLRAEQAARGEPRPAGLLRRLRSAPAPQTAST
jgi:hypothetical protein